MNFLDQKELRELEKDRIAFQAELNSSMKQFENSLKGKLGQDIKDVINGRIVVKMGFWEKLKYKINFYLTKLFHAL